jgi:hypothetical protein
VYTKAWLAELRKKLKVSLIIKGLEAKKLVMSSKLFFNLLIVNYFTVERNAMSAANSVPARFFQNTPLFRLNAADHQWCW